MWRIFKVNVVSLPEIMHIRLKQVGALKNDPEHIRYPRTLVIFSIFPRNHTITTRQLKGDRHGTKSRIQAGYLNQESG